jgi:hypothetical protein
VAAFAAAFALMLSVKALVEWLGVLLLLFECMRHFGRAAACALQLSDIIWSWRFSGLQGTEFIGGHAMPGDEFSEHTYDRLVCCAAYDARRKAEQLLQFVRSAGVARMVHVHTAYILYIYIYIPSSVPL